MMLELIHPHSFTEEERQSLWDQGVCLDDIDWILLSPHGANIARPDFVALTQNHHYKDVKTYHDIGFREQIVTLTVQYHA